MMGTTLQQTTPDLKNVKLQKTLFVTLQRAQIENVVMDPSLTITTTYHPTPLNQVTRTKNHRIAMPIPTVISLRLDLALTITITFHPTKPDLVTKVQLTNLKADLALEKILSVTRLLTTMMQLSF